jgi:NADH dehydrogenase FAD-containing subunit
MANKVVNMPERVLILGGGVGGVVAANVLSKTLSK